MEPGPNWSLKRIAERDGVSVAAISKAVAKLIEGHDLPVQRDARGRVALVDVAHFDHLRARAANAARVQAAATVAARETREPGEPRSAGNSDYNAALTEKTRYEATKRRLEVEEMQGHLVRVERVAEAAAQVGSSLATLIDQLPSSADRLAAAFAKDGTRGLQVALKDIANLWRSHLADQLEALAAGAPSADQEEELEAAA